jgi:hypothetical protein
LYSVAVGWWANAKARSAAVRLTSTVKRAFTGVPVTPA